MSPPVPVHPLRRLLRGYRPLQPLCSSLFCHPLLYGMLRPTGATYMFSMIAFRTAPLEMVCVEECGSFSCSTYSHHPRAPLYDAEKKNVISFRKHCVYEYPIIVTRMHVPRCLKVSGEGVGDVPGPFQ